MKFKEVEKSPIKFVGAGINTSVQKCQKDCPIIWNKFMKEYKSIKNYIGGMKNYGVCVNANEKDCSFKYIACAEVSSFEDIPKDMEAIEIPASKYLIFTHKGKLSGLGETYWKIMQEIQKINKKQRDFWIEFYDYRWKGDKDDSEMELWIAIQ